jgi:beta-lactamase regulating signal transducer with metallopeptidase domain
MIPMPGVSTWIELALKGAVVLAAAAAAVRALRGASAATRHLVWATALAVLVALPVVGMVVPRVSLGVPAWQSPTDDRTRPATDASVHAAGALPEALREPAADRGAPSRPAAARALPAATDILVAAWILGAALLVARTVAGHVGIRRMLRAARPLETPAWRDRLDVAAGEIGCRREVRLFTSGDLAVPVTCGLLSPAIVVPETARGWDDARARVVLLHELAHIRRHDCLVHLVAQCAVAIHWMNPLAWVAASRLRSERERACDDLVLGAGTSGPAYAEHLLDIARDATRVPGPAAPALAMARPSELEGRLLAVLDRNLPRATAGRHAVIAAIFVAVTAVTAVAAVTLQPLDVAPTQAVAPTPAPTPAPSPSPAPRPVTRGKGPASGGVAGGVSSGVAGGVAGGVSGGVSSGAASSAGEGRGHGGQAASPAVSPAVREGAVLALVAALKDEDEEVRGQAMHALVQLRAPQAFEPLVAALADPSADIRQQAAMALARMHDARAAAPLTKALGDSDAEVRQQAAFGLGQVGAKEAVPALVKALGDSEAEVRQQAAFALGRIGDPSAVEALTRALKDPEAEVRQQAAFALGQVIGHEPEER